MLRIQLPSAMPNRVVRIALSRASANSRQNRMPGSAAKNLLRTYAEFGDAKYSKYLAPKNQLRPHGDMRKSAKFHCTAANTPRKTAPETSACRQPPQSP